MSVASLAGPAAVAIAALLAALAIASAVIKASRDRADRRRAERARALRPRVIALAGGARVPDGLPAGDGPEARAVEATAIDVLPLLRGADRDALLRALDARGAIDRARRATYSRRPLHRAGAAETLGVCGVGRALPELGRLLRDRDREVRIVAARAMGKLGGPGAVPFLLASLEEPRPVPTSIVGMALARVGAEGVDGLREGLRGPSPRGRAVAAAILGQHGAVQATDELIAALDDREPSVRAAAAEALGRIGSPRAAAGLARILYDPAREVRAAAARALGEIGAAGAAEDVGRLLDVGESGVAWAAARALSRMGEAGRHELDARSDDEGLPGDYAREALAAAGVGNRPSRDGQLTTSGAAAR